MSDSLRLWIRRMYGTCGLCVSFILFFGNANCVTIQQTPSILVDETKTITINCSHDDNSLDSMYWYQQNRQTVMALIGYTYTALSDPKYEDEFKDQFKIIREDTLTGRLTISNLRQSDSAVYYCAASQHSAAHLHNSLTKTSHTSQVCYLEWVFYYQLVFISIWDFLVYTWKLNTSHPSVTGLPGLYVEAEHIPPLCNGRANSVTVVQTSFILINETEEIKITCKHDGSSLRKLRQYPPVTDDADLSMLEKFVITMYNKNSTADGVDDARLDTFAQKQRSYDAIPPTRASLEGTGFYKWYYKNSLGKSVYYVKSRQILKGYVQKKKKQQMNLFSSKEHECTSSPFFLKCSCCANGYNPAYFGEGTKLTVLDPAIDITPPTVRVLNVSKSEVCTKENVTLVCVAEDFYPDHVTVSWEIDGEQRTTDVSTDSAPIQHDNKFYSISSRLNIFYKEWTKGKTFTCLVRFFNETEKYEIYSDSIVGPKIAGDEDNAERYARTVKTTMLAYGMFIAKSFAYGFFILVIIKKQGFISK
ncbi:uncharacterized protein LOC132893681 [Neoarius graeffei]|uniref:uncharacterized protein LOC132893681 n=1 Tax=Neoarius graeffei TaxID=443677 RepID=UPI00298C4E59|nr:uncharacterized protein LOC132893681 [Neoarius graeffei]